MGNELSIFTDNKEISIVATENGHRHRLVIIDQDDKFSSIDLTNKEINKIVEFIRKTEAQKGKVWEIRKGIWGGWELRKSGEEDRIKHPKEGKFYNELSDEDDPKFITKHPKLLKIGEKVTVKSKDKDKILYVKKINKDIGENGLIHYWVMFSLDPDNSNTIEWFNFTDKLL